MLENAKLPLDFNPTVQIPRGHHYELRINQ